MVHSSGTDVSKRGCRYPVAPLRSYIAVAAYPAIGKKGWQGEGEKANRDREGVIILFPLTAESHANAPGGAGHFVAPTVSRR